MTSYESLADAAFAAAVDLQLQIETGEGDLSNFHQFAKLLKEPIAPGSSYKLLHDARNLPLYKEAWSHAYGQKAAPRLKPEDIADLLGRAEAEIDGWRKEEKQRIAEFCLALNRVFIEENAKNLISAFTTRTMHASS